MSDINFLDNKPGEDERPKDSQKEELVWSKPEKEAKSAKNSVFSFLPFVNKKKPALAIDKNKIKESRKEILNLIKHYENSRSLPPAKNKNFLRALGEKLKKQPATKEVLIDYQRIFNREKGPKKQIGQVVDVEPALKTAEKPKNDWLKRLIKKLFKSEAKETAKIIKSLKTAERKLAPVQPAVGMEKKPAEIKEIKFQEPAPAPKNEIRRRVLETNLIRGEAAAFFDWRSKTVILAAAILAPLVLVGAVYYGLAFYQKSSQAENSALVKKFAELGQEISREEAGLKEILAFQSSLKTVSQIFEQHIYWTNFFKFLEDNTIKDVYFVNFKGDTSGNYTMEAAAAAYGSIAEQVKVFRDNNKITAVLVNGGELAAGDDKNKSSVKFVLDFSILKNIFTE